MKPYGWPTKKQMDFIKKLIADRSHYTEQDYNLASLSRDGASKLIDQLLATQVKTAVEVLLPGLYRTEDGSVYKVQRSKHKHLYAKRMKPISGKRLNQKGEEIGFDFEYAPGAVKALKADQRMTLEQAQAFGIKYGVCCACGAFLKEATSVKLGIGPVCRTTWFSSKYPIPELDKKAEQQAIQAASWKSYGVAE